MFLYSKTTKEATLHPGDVVFVNFSISPFYKGFVKLEQENSDVIKLYPGIKYAFRVKHLSVNGLIDAVCMDCGSVARCLCTSSHF